MPKMMFRGAFIRFVDLRYDEKSKTPYVKINFTADFSEPIRQSMEWGEVPAGFTSADLEGELNLTHLILTPNGRELKQHELQINAKQLGEFKLSRVKGDDEESTHNELRFQVLTADPDAAAKLREYIANIGKGVAQLRVNCEVQETMDLGDSKSKADDSERLISKEQAEDTTEEDEPEGGPTLVPAVLAGGTHQRDSRRQRGRRGGGDIIDAETEEIVQ